MYIDRYKLLALARAESQVHTVPVCRSAVVVQYGIVSIVLSCTLGVPMRGLTTIETDIVAALKNTLSEPHRLRTTS